MFIMVIMYIEYMQTKQIEYCNCGKNGSIHGKCLWCDKPKRSGTYVSDD